MTYCQRFIARFLLVAAAFAGNTIVAQKPTLRQQPSKITIDSDILAALVDEPCHHFESARDQFLAQQYSQSAEHLRTASAYLRLEAARATAEQRAALHASVRELQAMAVAVEQGQVRSVNTLQQTFSRAHYALASHHCVKSAHRCCDPETFTNKKEMIRGGQDLRAAARHLEYGSRWTDNKLDEEVQRMLDASRIAADDLIKQNADSKNKAKRAIHRLHGKLEAFTGRKIRLARPLTLDDKSGPSIFR